MKDGSPAEFRSSPRPCPPPGERPRLPVNSFQENLFLKFGSLLLLALCVSWLALFASDRLWDTPVWAVTLSCSGWGALAFAWMIRRTAFERSVQKWLARQVRNRFGGPGDRL